MNVLITGGSSDIAISIVKRRLQLNDQVFITASSDESLEKTLLKYKQLGILEVQGFVYNLENPTFDSPILKRFLEGEKLSLILNAASRISNLKLFHEFSADSIKQSLECNILGQLLLIKNVIPSMIERNHGRIVFISSLSAVTGTTRYGLYAACKSGVEGLILNLAVDYAKFNILSNIVRLGFFKTSRTKRFWRFENYLKKVEAIIPQMKIGEPEIVGKSIDSLMEEEQYFNGAIFTLSGGLPLMRSEGFLTSKL